MAGPEAPKGQFEAKKFSIRLTEIEMQYITLLQGMTGTTVIDCIIDEERDRVIYLVKPGEVGLAVGRNGVNVKSLRKLLRKNIEIIEYAETLERLICNSLFPARVERVRLRKTADGRKIAIVRVHPEDKGLAIGRGGRNISRARILAKRYFDIDNVVIE